MRVLHLCAGNLYGGIETVLVALAEHRGLCPTMTPHFVLCFEGRLSQELAARAVPVHLVGPVRASRPLSVRRARKTLETLLRERQFDVAVAHSPWPLAVLGPASRSAGVPLALWLHGLRRGFHWVDAWARTTPPDLLIFNSRFTAASASGFYPGVPSECVYCPIGPPAPDRLPGDRGALRAALGTPEDATVVVQASRLEAWKGHALHLRALGLLGHLPGWVCWIVGGAQRPSELKYFETLQMMATELGISDRVRFVGQRDDVPGLLAAADVFCQPNTGPEPFGIAYVEALWSKLPVVATRFGGAQEIVDDSCGLLVAPGDHRALAASLERVIRDRDLRRTLGNAGPARARRLCDPATQMGALHRALGRVVGQEVTRRSA